GALHRAPATDPCAREHPQAPSPGPSQRPVSGSPRGGLPRRAPRGAILTPQRYRVAGWLPLTGGRLSGLHAYPDYTPVYPDYTQLSELGRRLLGIPPPSTSKIDAQVLGSTSRLLCVGASCWACTVSQNGRRCS